MNFSNLFNFVSILLILLIAGCASPSRMGMISDPKSGLQYGSVIEQSFFLDSSQFENNKMKISARNVSGDTNYNIKSFIKALEHSFAEKGYAPGSNNDFGIKYDVTIEYSGHIQENMASTYSFLGAAAGGIAGYRSDASAGTAIGLLTGATVGAIVGSYVTDDTYIIVAKVTIGTITKNGGTKKTVVFSSSPNLQEEETERGITPFDNILTTKVAVFAGGRNVRQAEIVEGVKKRLESIISDVI